MTQDGRGTWIARFYNTETRKEPRRSLGDFAHLPPHERFSAAKAEAEKWFDHLSGGGPTFDLTVRDICKTFAIQRPDDEKRFCRHVYDDPIANIALRKLTARHVESWVDRLKKKPALVSRHKNKDAQTITRPRLDSTVNRDISPFRAALNAAYDRNECHSDAAWRSALKSIKRAGNRRDIYLTREERKALLEKLAPDIKAFCMALSEIPLRPGAMAALCVKDFDHRRNTLTVPVDKGHEIRRIVLPVATAARFKEHTIHKQPTDPLFCRADGARWCKDKWKVPIKRAAIEAKSPAGTTAYSFRHSGISDLITSGLDISTTAKLCGTSALMIDKHYGYLKPDHAKSGLESLSL